VENVVIRSGDGMGVCGLDLTHHDCGPALVKKAELKAGNFKIFLLKLVGFWRWRS
jgi:hypothetical protein